MPVQSCQAVFCVGNMFCGTINKTTKQYQKIPQNTQGDIQKKKTTTKRRGKNTYRQTKPLFLLERKRQEVAELRRLVVCRNSVFLINSETPWLHFCNDTTACRNTRFGACLYLYRLRCDCAVAGDMHRSEPVLAQVAESQVLEQDPAQGGNEAVAVGVGHFDRTVCGVSRLAVLIDVLGWRGMDGRGLKSSPWRSGALYYLFYGGGVWLYLLYIVTYKFYKVTRFFCCWVLSEGVVLLSAWRPGFRCVAFWFGLGFISAFSL